MLRGCRRYNVVVNDATQAGLDHGIGNRAPPLPSARADTAAPQRGRAMRAFCRTRHLAIWHLVQR